MRQKRAKTYKKLMNLYSLSHGFRQPYQALVDASFCVYTDQNKIDVRKQVATVLQGEAKIMITQCCMVEMYRMGKEVQRAVDTAKDFERRKCNHREAIAGDDCVRSVVGETNKHRYVVASQSQELREGLRAIPFVPIIHVNRVVMVLEPPSDATLRAKALSETSAQEATAPEKAIIDSTKPVEDAPKPKKKSPKGPNPLSMKKKKQPQQPKSAVPSKASKPEDSKVAGSSKDVTDAASEGPRRSKKRKRGGEEVEELERLQVIDQNALDLDQDRATQPSASAQEVPPKPAPVNVDMQIANDSASTREERFEGEDSTMEDAKKKKKRRRKHKSTAGDDGPHGTDAVVPSAGPVVTAASDVDYY